jgi:predicted  nucleic acid-binding Zn-ribbon protein
MIETGEGYVPDFILDDRRSLIAEDEWESDKAEVVEIAAYYKRASAGVWTWLAVLTVALAAIALYGYRVLQYEDIRLAQIPAITKTLPAINQHIVGFEKQLKTWRSNQQALSAQMQTIDSSWKAALGRTSRQTHALAAQMQESLNKQINQRSAMFQNELTRLVNDRHSDQTRLAKIEDQLAESRFELESARQQYAQNLAALREQQDEQNRRIASLTSMLQTTQVSFEVQKNREVEVAPGVTLKLTKADVRRQLFDAWITSVSGNEKIYAENQGVLRPIVFYPREGGEAVKLVVTQIAPKGARGYLLIPAQAGEPLPSFSKVITTDDRPDSAAILPIKGNAAPELLVTDIETTTSNLQH